MKYQRLKDLREDVDLTQTQLAKIINMSQTGYSQYETGTNDIPTKILIKLALFYDTNIDYILGVTDIKTPYKRKKDVYINNYVENNKHNNNQFN